MNSQKQYFAEIEPLIQQRLKKLTRIIWVASLVGFIMGGTRLFLLYVNEGPDSPRLVHQLLASISFFPYVLTMIYAESKIKFNTRLAVQITLVATFCVFSSQLIIHGGQAAHAILMIPLLIVLAGFFANAKTTLIVTFATTSFIAVLTIADYMGFHSFHPEGLGYFSVLGFVYIAITLFIAYSLIKVVVQDYSTIHENLKTQKQSAEYIADHDALTGLYNRNYTEHVSDKFFAEAAPDEKGFVLFLDIDNFKMINTRFGHEGGDSVLKTIAQRLDEVAADHRAVVCRIGGDEFIVLLICSADEAKLFSRKLRVAVAEPFELFGETIQLTCSVGISNADKRLAFRDLYRQADTAMHRAKYTGKNIQVEHDQAYSDEELAYATILSNLKHALAHDEFWLSYQPQVDLKTGKVVGMEALIRWNMRGQEMRPDQFIEMAEQYGMIHSITNWVVQRACRDCKRLHELGYQHLFVAVNISAVYLEQNNLVQTVTKSLSESGLPARALELELTESALFQQDGSTGYEQLKQVRQLGVELSIDDFGTGYSNLQYLGQLDIQRLKIDKSFIMQLADTTNKSEDLTAVIVDIAKRFRLKTVAEGIETADVALAAHEMDCDIGQGYYWSKPVPFDELLALLNESREDGGDTFGHESSDKDQARLMAAS